MTRMRTVIRSENRRKARGGEKRGPQLRMGSRNAIESYIRNLYAGHAGSTVSTEDLNGQADWQTGRRCSKRQVVGEVAPRAPAQPIRGVQL